MKYKLFSLTILAMFIANSTSAQNLDFTLVKSIEYQLDDVMEIIDTSQLKVKLINLEQKFKQEPNEINKVRLGIMYHEIALNLTFFSKTEFKGYAKKSFVLLTDLLNATSTTKELMPFIVSYRASALSLMSAETKNLKLLSQAFELFGEAVKLYAEISYLPEFLRGSVAENLPWYFYTKRKVARQDFQSIINKQALFKSDKNAEYANWKAMSFTYWAWANQHRGRKDRIQAITYLDKAISLDQNYQAGRKKAEELKVELVK